jgi:hypothetical protein
VEADEDERWCASFRRRGVRFEVDCLRRGDQWVASVTRVRPGQRHRLALLQRPTLVELIAASELLVEQA